MCQFEEPTVPLPLICLAKIRNRFDCLSKKTKHLYASSASLGSAAKTLMLGLIALAVIAMPDIWRRGLFFIPTRGWTNTYHSTTTYGGNNGIEVIYLLKSFQSYCSLASYDVLGLFCHFRSFDAWYLRKAGSVRDGYKGG